MSPGPLKVIQDARRYVAFMASQGVAVKQITITSKQYAQIRDRYTVPGVDGLRRIDGLDGIPFNVV